MNKHTAAVCVGFLAFAVVATADARVVRRGGGGGRVAPAIGGTSTYLLPAGTYESGNTVPQDVLAGLPRYSYGSTGDPIQAHHNWGAACSENRQVPGTPIGNFYDCFFSLGGDESLDLGGHIVGLPDPSEYSGSAPIPTLSYLWTLTAGTQEYFWDQDSPETPLGDLLPRNAEDPDGFDETCFTRFLGYTQGTCQLLDFDSGPLTGAALLDAADGGDIFLDLTVSLLAPTGFEFINIWDYDYEVTDIRGLVQPSSFTLSDDGTLIEASAERMPIRVDVPIPGTALLVTAGLVLLGRRRKRS